MIARGYLTAREPQKVCEQFHSDYPGLGGIVTLSRIGYSDVGERAMVKFVHECGNADRNAAFLILARNDERWQVVEEKQLR